MADETTTDDALPDVVQMVHRLWRDSRDHTSDWRVEAKEDYDMVAGEQWASDDLQSLTDQQRPAVTFNRILRTINVIVGSEVSNRQETRFIPREVGDVQVNEVLTAAAEWTRDQTDTEDEETDAFEDMCTTGMGWTETRMDYVTDPDGIAITERLDPLEMYWDPGARKRNIVDARWKMHIRQMSIAEFEDEWPDADLVAASSPWDEGEDDTSIRTHVYPQDAYREQQSGGAGPRGRPTIRVAHVQWAEKVGSYRVGKRAASMSSDQYDKLRGKLEERGIPAVRQDGVQWKRAFIAGGTVLEEGDCPYPDGPTFRCMTYKRNRNKNIWFGIVRAMKDPQRWGNKFFSQILDILNKGAKGGIMIEADAVDDMADLEATWASSDAVHKFKPGALSQGKIMPKPVVDYPVGLDRLMAFSMDAVHEVTGVNLELLGFADRDQPGILEHQRKQAGLTILAPLFDSLRKYRKDQGRVLLHFIQKFMSDGRLIRIMGQNGNEQFVPLAKQEEAATYDIIVDESPTSPNMKERVFGSMVQMMPILGKMGVPLPPELLDYAPLPSSLAHKWKALIEKSAGADPEAIQKQMEEGRQIIEKLQQENAALKDKRAEAEANIQLKQAETQADLEMKAAEQQHEEQLAIAKHQAEMETLERKHALEVRALEHKMALAERELQIESTIAGAKADAEIERADRAAEAQARNNGGASVNT